MDGRQHYEKAEKLLDQAQDVAANGRLKIAAVLVAQAQVHATLAAATASAWPGTLPERSPEDDDPTVGGS